MSERWQRQRRQDDEKGSELQTDTVAKTDRKN